VQPAGSGSQVAASEESTAAAETGKRQLQATITPARGLQCEIPAAHLQVGRLEVAALLEQLLALGAAPRDGPVQVRDLCSATTCWESQLAFAAVQVLTG
jgi:hypothetical protein